MKRILVTGGSGFIGANLVRRLVRDGHDVHLIVRPSADRWRLAGVDVPCHAHSIVDPEAVRATFAAVRPERVFHLATHGAYAWQADPHPIVETNVLGTLNLLEAGRECEALVMAGSSSEYGFRDHPTGEDDALDPNSWYACGKAAATMLWRHAARQHDLHAPCLRLFSVYGPFEDPDRLIPTLIRCGMEGRLPPLVDPRVARDFVHVDDVVEAFVRVAEAHHLPRGTVLNVGSGRQTTMAEVVEVARRMLGVADEPRWGSMPDRAWDTRTWVADITRIGQALGWQPRFDLEAGLQATVDWHRARRP